MNTVACSRCDDGAVTAQRIHRLRWPWVAAGYVLLVLSLAALASAGWLIFAYAYAYDAGNEEAARKEQEQVARLKATREQAAKDLKKLDVPEAIIAKVVDMKEIPEDELAGLKEAQKGEIARAQNSIKYEAAGAAIGAFGRGLELSFRVAGWIWVLVISALIGILSLLGLLGGWLLIRKKIIFQCDRCGAAASQ